MTRSRMVLLAFALLCSAQAQKTESFDVFTFAAPTGWQRDATSSNVLKFSRVKGGQYCLFGLYRAIRGTGKAQSDFGADWQSLVVGPLKPEGNPENQAGDAKNGWQNWVGGANFQHEGSTSLALLSTYSGGGQAASILMLTNDPTCVNDLERFLAAMTLKKPSASAVSAPTAPAASAVKSRYAFSTTNFDDGWVSVEQKDWMLSKKGTVTVRLHYPNAALKEIFDSDKLLTEAWNTLVAPHYRDLQGYKQDFDTMNYFRPYLAAGTATSTETGQRVYVSLFRQEDSGWIEVVTPDKATFVNQFGVDIDHMDALENAAWSKLKGLRGLNRFAVAASDLQGEWSSNASGMTQWVNSVTGLSAGATGFSSNETFEFGPNGTYHWSIVLASGVIGAQKFQSAKSDGKLSMKGHWQISFSNIENKPRLFNAYFEVGRGVRILWLMPSDSSGANAFVRVK